MLKSLFIYYNSLHEQFHFDLLHFGTKCYFKRDEKQGKKTENISIEVDIVYLVLSDL